MPHIISTLSKVNSPYVTKNRNEHCRVFSVQKQYMCKPPKVTWQQVQFPDKSTLVVRQTERHHNLTYFYNVNFLLFKKTTQLECYD